MLLLSNGFTKKERYELIKQGMLTGLADKVSIAAEEQISGDFGSRAGEAWIPASLLEQALSKHPECRLVFSYAPLQAGCEAYLLEIPETSRPKLIVLDAHPSSVYSMLASGAISAAVSGNPAAATYTGKEDQGDPQAMFALKQIWLDQKNLEKQKAIHSKAFEGPNS